MFEEYWESEIKPHVDGVNVEYVGEVDLAAKNELFGNAMAMLFPIQWDEPFGLVMIEAMACGTPVLALPGGSVSEVVRNGASGWICSGVDDMADKISTSARFAPSQVRAYVEKEFSLDCMVQKYEALYSEILGENLPRGIVADLDEEQRAIA
jgi:glycosyltransferase involved in cell wall biosynthesis